MIKDKIQVVLDKVSDLDFLLWTIVIFGSAFQLHVYPGYEPDEVTPLPEPLQPKDILQTVINAQRDLRKKVKGIKGVNISIAIQIITRWKQKVFNQFHLTGITIEL